MSFVRGEKLRFDQAAGPEIRLTVFGDEFYARYENEDGFTVVYDTELGLFCYALVIRGEFVSSGVPVSQPRPDALRRHLRESGAIREIRFERRRGLSMPAMPPGPPVPTLRSYGPERGLLSGRKLHEGTVLGLTVIVEFPDKRSELTAQEVSAMLNDEGYSENGNHCSVRDYFLRVSGGKLDYANEVHGPIMMSKKREAYVYPRENLLVMEALSILSNQGIEFNRFDSNGDGRIDAINIMYAGWTTYAGWLWPHNFVIDMALGDVSTEYYQISSLGSASIGTFCHENGHMLCRFPDLYDYGDPTRDGDAEDSTGLGKYCLMSMGNHLNQGRTPSSVSAYLRHLAGWTTEVVSLNEPGRFEAAQGDYSTAMKYFLGEGFENEFFLVENRFSRGLDEHLPSSGLAVYHCDTEGSNEYQDQTPSRHYQCALLQADGRNDLERNANSGDASDLFPLEAEDRLDYHSNPSTRRWDRSDSGLIIRNISGPGPVIKFEIG